MKVIFWKMRRKMKKTSPNIIIIALTLAASLVAAALMLQVTANSSWLAFIGWVIFYLSIQVPLFLYTQKSQESCTAWVSRLMKRETR